MDERHRGETGTKSNTVAAYREQDRLENIIRGRLLDLVQWCVCSRYILDSEFFQQNSNIRNMSPFYLDYNPSTRKDSLPTNY